MLFKFCLSKLLAAFFLWLNEAQRKKANKKRNAEERFRHCGGEEGSASPHRELLKKLEQNFPDLSS